MNNQPRAAGCGCAVGMEDPCACNVSRLLHARLSTVGLLLGAAAAAPRGAAWRL